MSLGRNTVWDMYCSNLLKEKTVFVVILKKIPYFRECGLWSNVNGIPTTEKSVFVMTDGIYTNDSLRNKSKFVSTWDEKKCKVSKLLVCFQNSFANQR